MNDVRWRRVGDVDTPTLWLMCGVSAFLNGAAERTAFTLSVLIYILFSVLFCIYSVSPKNRNKDAYNVSILCNITDTQYSTI